MIIMRLVLTGLAAGLLLAAGPATAQIPDPRLELGSAGAAWHTSTPADVRPMYALRLADTARADQTGAGWVAVGGAAGGAVGFLGGLAVGAMFGEATSGDCRGYCSLDAMAYAGLAGEALGVALGVHYANGREGSLPGGLLVSAGVLGVGVAARRELPMPWLIVPAAQILGAMLVERTPARP